MFPTDISVEFCNCADARLINHNLDMLLMKYFQNLDSDVTSKANFYKLAMHLKSINMTNGFDFTRYDQITLSNN